MNKNYPKKFYNVWQNMKRRCSNPKSQNYQWYGGRGIAYDEKWETIEGFYNDMFNDWKENLELDRVDVNKDYTKENCRWITHKENCYNRRSNVLITINEETLTLTEWSLKSNVPIETIWSRLQNGTQGEELIKINSKIILDKQSGVKGIRWLKRDNKWVIDKYINGKKKRLASFNEDELEKAKQFLNEYKTEESYY